MGNYDFVDVEPQYVWVDTPGNEFVDAQQIEVAIVRLANPQLIDVTELYYCYIVEGGVAMLRKKAIIRAGHANTLKMKMLAEQVDINKLIDLPESQANDIVRVVLHLGAGQKIDSNTVGLGPGKPFEIVVDTATGAVTLLITVGTTTEIQTMAGKYWSPHLDVYMTGQTFPVSFSFPPTEVLAAD